MSPDRPGGSAGNGARGSGQEQFSLSATLSLSALLGVHPSSRRQVGTQDMGVTWRGESRVWWILACRGPGTG